MINSEMLTVIFGVVSCLSIILGVVWKHSLWLSNQFNSLRELIYIKIDSLEESMMTKLQDHIEHDDERIQELNNKLWEVRLKGSRLINLMPNGHKIQEELNK